MSYLSTRIVKNKKYYYLEESFLFNEKLIKESIYIGAISPSNDELFLAQEMLARTCMEKNHTMLVPPLTEFISNRTAKIIQAKKVKYREKISQLNEKQLKEIFKNNLELLFLNHFEEKTLSIEHKRMLKKIFSYYETELNQNKLISFGFIHNICSILNGKKIVFSKENESLLYLLIKWFNEKDNLIHPVEFAAKFHSKFLSISPLEKNNELAAQILMNFILKQKDFPFVIISKRRKKSYNKAIIEGKIEEHETFTKFLIKEVVKEIK